MIYERESESTCVKTLTFSLVLLLVPGALIHAQHHHEGEPDSAKMTHINSRNLPMSRNGSGTAWLPDASPMYGYMHHHQKWMFMVHGNLFLRYNHQDVTGKGSRGGAKWDAPNWVMLMAQRPTGKKGVFHFSTMFSLDALTMGGSGYPLLFQTGESWEGKPLVDRQHPHDLFSELAIGYSHSFTRDFDAFVYLGYPGEPAIGPVAFMHRPSALSNPDAPLSHHWSDATHITFGVGTIGVRYGKFKLEGSSFTGREPDEKRFNFDTPRFDSWSGRLSFNPTEHWALQVSRAMIHSPEALHPEENTDRTSASVIYSTRWNKHNLLNASLVWGLNTTEGRNEHAFLGEAAMILHRTTFYTRYEWLQKSGEELDLEEQGFAAQSLFPVQAITIGASYDLIHSHSLGSLAVGGHFTFFHADPELDGLYGRNPVSAEVFLRICPPLMNAGMKM